MYQIHEPTLMKLSAGEKHHGLEPDTNEDDMKRAQTILRQGLAECLGTFLLVLLGDGAIAQYKIQSEQNKQQQDFLTVALGYGFALMIGILASGGVSGGHLNPAVTLAMAALRKCQWGVLPIYWAAQYLGAFIAAAVLYGTYADGINVVLGGANVTTGAAGIFASYPNEASETVTLVMDQALGTAVLLVIILAVTDGKNMKVDSGLVAPLIGLGLAAIHISLAFNAGCAINPARDFAP